MTVTSDAVVVGSGINGLVVAAELASAGWDVVLVERNEQLGGFVASEERTVSGYVHDTFSSWHSLFVSGAAYATLADDLHRHGLRYRNAEGLLCESVNRDGNAVVAERDPAQTAANFMYARDEDRYLSAIQDFLDHAGPVGELMSSELRSPALLKHGAKLFRALGKSGTEHWLNDLVSSGRAWCRREFSGPEVDRLWMPWLLHAGPSPDHAGGGFMLPVLAATLHGFGLPVVEGGAGNLVEAFVSLLRERGVRIRTGVTVEKIVVEGGRAVGVVSGDEQFRARRAVIASVTPTALYGQLLPPGSAPEPVMLQANDFRYRRGAMQMHVALSSPLVWQDERLSDVPLIHVSDGSASTGIACAQAEAGLLPERQTIVIGRQYLLDRTRVPVGTASLWLQLQETPYAPIGEAAGRWTTALADGYSERVLDRIAERAPDLRTKILAVDVLTPLQLEAANPNAVAGDPYGGAAELDQSFMWRPLRSAASHQTPVEGLWHIGASTHPGGGTRRRIGPPRGSTTNQITRPTRRFGESARENTRAALSRSPDAISERPRTPPWRRSFRSGSPLGRGEPCAPAPEKCCR